MSKLLTRLPSRELSASRLSVSSSAPQPPLSSVHRLLSETAVPPGTMARLCAERQQLERQVIELHHQLAVAGGTQQREDERRRYEACLHEKAQEIERLERRVIELEQAVSKVTVRAEVRDRRELRRREKAEHLASEQKLLAHHRQGLERKREVIQKEEERIRGAMDELERCCVRNQVERQRQDQELHALFLALCHDLEEAQKAGISEEKIQALKSECHHNAPSDSGTGRWH